MRRWLVIGVVLVTVVVGYAAATERAGLGFLLRPFQPSERLPALKSKELPFQYPARLWRSGVEGEVVLKIHISEAGAVDSVELQRSSGHTILDAMAIKGARRLQYHPARRGDEPVAVWALLPVRFERQSVTATTEGM